MDQHRDITLVITSCRRFDLLERTLASMHSWVGRFPHRIIVEDSDQRPQLFRELESEGFSVLVNGMSLGQHRSIDSAYRNVTTNFIFHCEDDWEFSEEPNFNAAKHILTNGVAGHAKISVVSFRDSTRNKPNDQNAYRELQLMGGQYRYSLRQKSKYNSFTFNPSVLRRDLRKITGSYSDFLTEGSIARYLRQRGYIIVTQVPGVVQHIGDERGITRGRHSWGARLSQWFKKGV